MTQHVAISSMAEAFSELVALVPNVGIWKISPEERHYRLERMRWLLERLGNPQRAYRIIHLAGTKGKGSTAAFLASALGTAGYQTGLYTSPHVSDPGERISVSKLPTDRMVLVELVGCIREIVLSVPVSALPGGFSWTVFELVTAFALLYFRETRCQFAVIETGIGGRWDATNVVEPMACVLTPVDLEHTDILGSTLKEIASEKSGIIKPGVPVFSAKQEPEVQRVFTEVSRQQSAPLVFVHEKLIHFESHMHTDGTDVELRFRGMRAQRFQLKLLGAFQAQNVALAYLTLRQTLPRIPCHQIITGLERAFLPGRMELIRTSPPIILDGAHTPLAIQNALLSFKAIFPSPAVLIFGAIAGKNIADMAKLLAAHFEHIIISTPGTFKESSLSEMLTIFHALNPHTMLEPNPENALQKAIQVSQTSKPILVTGSFFMVAEIRKFLV